ncbi:MAG: hypothetical protein ABIZ70_03830 [Gemmatimonadales bacterium]
MRLPVQQLLIVLALAGCTSATGANGLGIVPVPGSVRMRVGDTVRLGSVARTLTFSSVRSDSRCPVDVTCIQAGETSLEFVLDNPLSAQPRPPAMQVILNGVKPDTVAGLVLRVTRVEPARHAGKEIAAGEYVVTVAIAGQYAPD